MNIENKNIQVATGSPRTISVHVVDAAGAPVTSGVVVELLLTAPLTGAPRIIPAVPQDGTYTITVPADLAPVTNPATGEPIPWHYALRAGASAAVARGSFLSGELHLLPAVLAGDLTSPISLAATYDPDSASVSSAAFASPTPGGSAAITLDATPTQDSTNAVTSGGVYAELNKKQAKLTFDTTPKSGSTNPVTSGGVYSELNKKQAKLTFDTTPKSGSTNPVTSGGVYTALKNPSLPGWLVGSRDSSAAGSLALGYGSSSTQSSAIAIGYYAKATTQSGVLVLSAANEAGDLAKMILTLKSDFSTFGDADADGISLVSGGGCVEFSVAQSFSKKVGVRLDAKNFMKMLLDAGGEYFEEDAPSWGV